MFQVQLHSSLKSSESERSSGSITKCSRLCIIKTIVKWHDPLSILLPLRLITKLANPKTKQKRRSYTIITLHDMNTKLTFVHPNWTS